jgi:hypothetical protein
MLKFLNKHNTKISLLSLVISITALVISLLAEPAQADTLYFKVGAGYKLNELKMSDEIDGTTNINVTDTATFELGIKNENLTYGIRHVSNYSRGWPFDNGIEYRKDELFIEYQFDIMEF